MSKGEKKVDELFNFNHNHNHKKLSKQSKDGLSSAIGFLVTGIIALLFSAEIVVKNAIILADAFGVTQTLIGTMVIGISTALPELTTALIGIKRGARDLSLGVLIGSNITNPLFALGLGAVIAPLTMANSIEYFDLPFWFFISA